MGFFSRFERHVEDGFEGINDKLFDAPISPVQIAKKAEKQMRREKMVGAGKEYAPTLYTVLVNPDDDTRLFGYYPTLAGETETYLRAKAMDQGLAMDGNPLVRFIVDDELKPGKFDVIAELVSAPIIQQLRHEEMTRYGLGGALDNNPAAAYANQSPAQRSAASQSGAPGAPGVPQGYAQGQSAYQPASSGIDVMAEPASQYQEAVEYAQMADDVSAQAEGTSDPSVNMPAADLPASVAVGMPSAPHQAVSSEGADIPAVGKTMNINAVHQPASSRRRHGAPTPHLVNLDTGRSFVLSAPRVIIGRGTNCNIILNDLNASRTHATIMSDSSSWTLSDLGSTNGTMLNGRPISQAVLKEGDRIIIGTTTLLFTYN